jgi:hypothetical protein
MFPLLSTNSYASISGFAKLADATKPNLANLVVTFNGIPCKY